MKRRINMPMDDKTKIQVFDVRDYKAWKKRILMYLKCKKCYELATRETMDTKDRQWMRKIIGIKRINGR